MTDQSKSLQSGLFCVAILTRMYSNPIGMDQLKHHFSTIKERIQPIELARILNEAGFKATPAKKDLRKIKSEFFPIISESHNGEFLLLAKLGEKNNSILVQRAEAERAEWVLIEDLLQALTGVVIFVKKRVENHECTKGFGLKWFFRSSLKYWSILRDCLLASFFVQIFGLLSPLVFMIVIDRVLTNNSLSTLDVLVFALIVVSIFEIIFNTLRTYLLSHTANRIDLMLGIQLFKHLMTLSLSYFESRQVGDTIATIYHRLRFATLPGSILSYCFYKHNVSL